MISFMRAFSVVFFGLALSQSVYSYQKDDEGKVAVSDETLMMVRALLDPSAAEALDQFRVTVNEVQKITKITPDADQPNMIGYEIHGIKIIGGDMVCAEGVLSLVPRVVTLPIGRTTKTVYQGKFNGTVYCQ